VYTKPALSLILQSEQLAIKMTTSFARLVDSCSPKHATYGPHKEIPLPSNPGRPDEESAPIGLSAEMANVAAVIKTIIIIGLKALSTIEGMG
jgi:hypothetical protein